MKKLNVLRILAIVIIAAIGIVSCSKEESNVTANSTYTLTDVQRLKAEFKDIMASDEYSKHILSIKSMVTNLKDAGTAPIENRNDFKDWVSLNITKTKYANVNAAMDAYDDMIESGEVYNTKYNSFFNELRTLKKEDIRFVLSDGFGVAPVVTNATPCQDYCMDKVEDDIDFLDEQYAAHQHEWTTHYQRTQARFEYWSSMLYIVENFNDCMGSC